MTLAATAFIHSPVGWSATESATLPTAGLTAWRALTDHAKLKAGDTVVVQGTGGVSLFAVHFSKMMGATVIATSSSEAKLQRLIELGADYTINYRRQTEWGEIVQRLTQQRGADVVIDVGGPATLEQSMLAAKLGGHIALIGILSGFEGNIPFIPAISKQLRLQGTLVGNHQPGPAPQSSRWRQSGGLRTSLVVRTEFVYERGVSPGFRKVETSYSGVLIL